MDYYIWSDKHNNDVNVVVQLHTTNKVIIRCRQQLLLVQCLFEGIIGNVDI